MPPRCPICDKEIYTGTRIGIVEMCACDPKDRLIKKLTSEVEMLRGANTGWQQLDATTKKAHIVAVAGYLAVIKDLEEQVVERRERLDMFEPAGDPCAHCGQPTPSDGQIYNLFPSHEVGGRPVIRHKRCQEFEEQLEHWKGLCAMNAKSHEALTQQVSVLNEAHEELKDKWVILGAQITRVRHDELERVRKQRDDLQKELRDLKEEHAQLMAHPALKNFIPQTETFTPNPDYKGPWPECLKDGGHMKGCSWCAARNNQENSAVPELTLKVVLNPCSLCAMSIDEDWVEMRQPDGSMLKFCNGCALMNVASRLMSLERKPQPAEPAHKDEKPTIPVCGPDLNGFDTQDTCWVCDQVPDVVRHAEGSSKPAYRFRLTRIVLEHQGFTGGGGPEDSPLCAHVGEQAHMRSKRQVWVCEPCVEALKIIIKESPALSYTREGK